VHDGAVVAVINTVVQEHWCARQPSFLESCAIPDLQAKLRHINISAAKSTSSALHHTLKGPQGPVATSPGYYHDLRKKVRRGVPEYAAATHI
jgi:hypothetical protein